MLRGAIWVNQKHKATQSQKKKMLGCKPNNTSFENYFRRNSSSGHDLQGWKPGPTEAKSKTPADLRRTWLPPKANFSSLSQALQLQTFISNIFVAFLSHQRDPSSVTIQEPLTRWKKFNLQLKNPSINFFSFKNSMSVTWSPGMSVSIWPVEESHITQNLRGLGLCSVLFLHST